MVDGRDGGGEVSSFKAVNQANSEPTRGEDSAQASTLKIGNLPEKKPKSKAPSKASSKASSRRNSIQAATASDLRQPQTATSTPTAAEQVAQAQPMATTTSDSSHIPTKDTAESTVAPYGTRSRNRPARKSRINYAEDVDVEFELNQGPPRGKTSEPPSRGSMATEGGQSAAVGGKKGSGPEVQGNAQWGNSVANAKDQPPNTNIPGTSTFAANPNSNSAQPPKRRKNAASHAASAAPSHAGGRRGHQANQAMIPANSTRETNMMTFEKTGAFLINGRLEADNGQTVSVNDQVYLVCEPPGDPYYLCRVMEFQHVNGDPQARVDAMRVNWFYRPRDVQRYNNDTRLVYATMHSDICPITSLRGRCQILHRAEIKDLDEYRKQKDSFWFNQVFDRFIHRWYDVIPTSQVINVPDKVKKALDERWKYICLETSRVKELTSAVKSCKRCAGFCASNDSVECAVCHNTYHMTCVRPALQKKPSRGFAWACGPCSRAQEKKLEARRTPLLGSGNEEGDEEEVVDEEEEEAGGETTAPSPEDPETHIDQHPATQAEIALAKMWPMRYLGIHCRVEDALQYDDRAIYPRASSRLGPRHQANVNVWHGRPVELVKPAEIKKRYVKSSSHKKDAKLHKDTIAAIEADKAEKAKRPKWVMDEPPGYVHRGEDYSNKDPKCTAELVFKMPPLGVHSTRGEDDAPTVTEEQVEAYMTRAKALAKDVGVQPWSTNFLTKCLALFTKYQYDAEAALKQVKKLDRRKDLGEPELTKEEEKKWNEGVAKYGSEIRSVRLHTSKTLSYGDAVRYYYMWKKTPKGKEIWGSYSNRKGKNKKAAESDAGSRLLDDVADDQDDSAFDSEKAMQRKRGFQCKFCNSRNSRQWRRAPGVAPGQTVAADGRASKANSIGFVLALCQRCANLWRKYAVKWENTDEIAKKVAQGGGKAWKRRIDEELLREVYAATAEASTANGTPEYAAMPHAVALPVTEPPKKKQKTIAGSVDSGTSTPANEPVSKKKEKKEYVPPPKPPTPPPIIPAQPRLRNLPCAVCRQVDGPRLECSACRMTVHKSCYGVDDVRHVKWFCDTCKNDKKESVSYTYECVLCPQKVTEQELYEPPKVSHKKKTDREREKERLEKELVDKAREEYRQKQLDKGRPIFPREPLKRTADNNWVHVYCALWIPETKFTKPNRLDMVEGVGAPTLRYDTVCKLCKTDKGACVSCLHCHANFHVGCAHSAGYTFGFDINPVKATRRDAVATVTINGESGSMTAGVWCKDHAPKGIHPMNEEVEGSGMVALQLYAREFKQADLTLTGTARKANLVDQSTRIVPQIAASQQTGRRSSHVPNHTPTSARSRQSNVGPAAKDEESTEAATPKPERNCVKCKIDVSPRWWKVEDEPVQAQSSDPMEVDGAPSTNGVTLNGHAHPEHTPHSQNSQPVNGSTDHAMPDAPSAVSSEPGARLTVDTDISIERSVSYLCQKCHWKKLHAPEESPEPEKPQPVIPESPQLPARSSPVQLQLAPPQPWLPPVTDVPPSVPPYQHQHQPPAPLSMWHNGPPPPGPHLHNGIGHPPHPGPPLGHHPPFHSPYAGLHQPNGYTPYSAPPVHPMPPAPLRGYPNPHGPPPPPPALHMNGNGMMVNGMHSPHLPYSPTHPPVHGRLPESPYAAPNQPVPFSHHHTNQAPGSHSNRPSTPRDSIMRDAPRDSIMRDTSRDSMMRDAPRDPLTRDTPSAAPPPEQRASTGASASPSLRNLLH